MPLAFSSAVRVSARRTALVTVRWPVHPLFEFRVPPESCPTSPSRPAAAADTSHGLCVPSAHQEAEVHLPRAVPPPTTVRPQGLATLSAVYALRAPAGFFSHRRRSWDSPFGAFSSRKVSAAFPRGRTHMPFAASVIPPPKRWAGPTSRGFWGSALPGIPGGTAGINLPATGCSHGLRPSRACRRQPCRGFRPSSSHTLRRPQSFDRSPPASRSLNRLSPDPAAERAR
jgi:hypothetical protein